MRLNPSNIYGSYIMGRILGNAIVWAIPLLVVGGIVLVIVEAIREAVAIFLASPFYAHLVAMWDAIIAFFQTYGWIFVLGYSLIGFITTLVLSYWGAKRITEWVEDKVDDWKYRRSCGGPHIEILSSSENNK